MKKIILFILLLVVGDVFAVTSVRDLDLAPLGRNRVVTGTIGFDDSYATGGEVITPQMIGLASIEMMIFGGDPYGMVFNFTTDSYGGEEGNVQIHNFSTYADDGGNGIAASRSISEHPTFNVVVDSYGEIVEGANLTRFLSNVKFMAIGL